MKAAVLTGIRTFEIRDVPEPKIFRETDVRIRVTMVGVCGSDIHYYTTGRIGSQIIQFPFIIGHEASGIVEQVGKKVTRVMPGQRIAIEPAVSCGHCDQCTAGREHTCRELLFLGCPSQLDGCLCEYIVMDEKCCFPIPEHMTDEQAALSEPLAIGVYSVERSVVTEKTKAAILGAGPIGMSVFHVLRTQQPANIYVTDKIEKRIQYAQALHPAWSGNPDTTDIVKEILSREPLQLDTVFECSGDPAAILQGIQLLKPGGTLILVGIPETDEVFFPIHELRRKEITILSIRRQVHCTQKAIDFIAQKKIIMDALATHRFSLEKTQDAFDLVAQYRDGVMKAMVAIR